MIAPQLPFHSEPKTRNVVLGNERIGTLEFPVLGDLTVNEQAWLAANGAEKSAFAYTSRAALKIARAEKVEPIIAHNFVARVLGSAMGATLELDAIESQWVVKYVKDLEEAALKVVEVSTKQQNLLVTCMIRFRLPGMQEWTPSDTSTISSELAEEIMKFAQVEQSRGQYQTAEEADTQMKELLGKQLTERGRSQQPLTGEKSSISSDSSIPATQISPPNDSDGSKPDTLPNASDKETNSDETTYTP